MVLGYQINTEVVAVIDFEKWMGVTGNALDFAFDSNSNAPDILLQFAISCINATEIKPDGCPLALASMNTSDPASDIVRRVNNILAELAANGPYISKTNTTYAFTNTAGQISHTLSFPETWALVASRLLSRENTIQSQNKTSNSKREVSNSNLLFSDFNISNPFYGSSNGFVRSAVINLDLNYANITDINSFVQSLSQEATEDGFIVYRTMWAATGLGWPNLTAYNIERFTGPFPSNIRNKILIVAAPYSEGYPLTSAMNTYEFLGPDNAAFFVHNGFGSNFTKDPNDCTMETIMAYFANGANFPLMTH
jgi:hypothetical protein